MKKYVKPELIYEHFELSQQIAACQFDSNNTLNDRACQFTGDETAPFPVTIFVNGSCPVDAEIYCEHNGTDFPGVLFNS